MRKELLTIVALWVSATLLASCAVSSRPIVPVEDLLTPAVIPTLVADGETAPLQPPDAIAGAAIYAQRCAACHGPQGAGNGPRAEQIRGQGKLVANLVNPARLRAVKPSDWHTIITTGRIQNLMPPFNGSLNAQQRWDVQAYLWALGTTTQTIQSGQAIYQAQCAACHGPNGATAVGAGEIKRALNDPRLLADRSLLDISSGMLRGDPHKNLTLDETQRFAVADYVRSLSYRYAAPSEIRAATLTGDGVINLRAVNGTPGGQRVANAPVTLRAYDSTSEVLSRTAQLNDESFVSFTGLPRRADYFYQAELDYSGGRFFAAPAQFPVTGTTVISDVLPIFETTEETNTNTLSISEMYVFVQDVTEGRATMVEYYLFDNASDRAYIGVQGGGEKRRTLKLSAPKDAQNLRFDGLGLGQRFFQDGNVIYDSDVVVPGQRAAQATMIYEVPYRNGRSFERSVFYPVQRASVLVPEVIGPGTPLTVTGLLAQGLQQTPSGNLYLFLNEKPLAPGESLRFDLRGQPLGSETPGTDGRAIGFGLIAFGIAVGSAYFLIGRVRALRSSEGTSSFLQQREQLLQQMAALDDAFLQGRVGESNYQAQRSRLKETLKEMWE